MNANQLTIFIRRTWRAEKGKKKMSLIGAENQISYKQEQNRVAFYVLSSSLLSLYWTDFIVPPSNSQSYSFDLIELSDLMRCSSIIQHVDGTKCYIIHTRWNNAFDSHQLEYCIWFLLHLFQLRFTVSATRFSTSSSFSCVSVTMYYFNK